MSSTTDQQAHAAPNGLPGDGLGRAGLTRHLAGAAFVAALAPILVARRRFRADRSRAGLPA